MSETVLIVTPPVKLSPEVKSSIGVRRFMRAALAGGGLLLLSNLPVIPGRLHAYLSAVPLAIAGLAYATLQFRLRPARGTLLKRLVLAATFMAWAVDQLLPSGRLATFISDAVITAYVLDLFWLSQEQASANFRVVDGGEKPSETKR
jgi:hypothetical protein